MDTLLLREESDALLLKDGSHTFLLGNESHALLVGDESRSLLLGDESHDESNALLLWPVTDRNSRKLISDTRQSQNSAAQKQTCVTYPLPVAQALPLVVTTVESGRTLS